MAIAVRPNARSLAVAQGKGLTPGQARISAVMEAIDAWHAEDIFPRFHRAAYSALAAAHRVADPALLARTARPFEPNVPIDWIEATDLLAGGACWVPAECVHTDYRLPRPPGSGFFCATTNGLAGGNHLLEALVAGIAEVIERDAFSLFAASPAGERARRRLDPDSIDDPACRALIDRCTGAGMAVRLWNASSDIGVAAFLCELADAADPAVRAFAGMGCHPARPAALVRAITEAAQARLTVIAGMRDDLEATLYDADPLAGFMAALAPPGRADFRDAPDFTSDDLGADLDFLLARLRSAGIGCVAAIDLTRPEFAIPVAKIVIPGLEGRWRHPDYTPGPRARALLARA